MHTSVGSEGDEIPVTPPSSDLRHSSLQIPSLSVATDSEETSDTASADTPLDTPRTPLSQITGNGIDFNNQSVEYGGTASYEESETASPVPSGFSGVLENGRHYPIPMYGQSQYGLPLDCLEQKRLRIQHAKYLVLFNGKLFHAPISVTPQQILDLGTGIGLWATDVAEEYPAATVIATDLAPIQPTILPQNCHVVLDDAENSWRFGEKRFDLIHARDLVQSIRDWPKLVEQAHRSLKPGGWLELACEYLWPYCDDSSLPQNSAIRKTCELLGEANDLFGTPVSAPYRYAHYLRQNGFVNVVGTIHKIPSGPWPTEARANDVGKLQQLNLSKGATAFGLRVFQTAFGWPKKWTEAQMAHFMEDVWNPAYHTYFH